MIRRVFVSDKAEEEIREAERRFSEGGVVAEFLSQVRVVSRALQEFPFSKGIHQRVGDMEIRRAKVARFPFWLFYFVYPSVDLQSGDPLDIIYVLGCRHERQGEPNWEERDPFRL